jgi:hypothetical protein
MLISGIDKMLCRVNYITGGTNKSLMIIVSTFRFKIAVTIIKVKFEKDDAGC